MEKGRRKKNILILITTRCSLKLNLWPEAVRNWIQEEQFSGGSAVNTTFSLMDATQWGCAKLVQWVSLRGNTYKMYLKDNEFQYNSTEFYSTSSDVSEMYRTHVQKLSNQLVMENDSPDTDILSVAQCRRSPGEWGRKSNIFFRIL
jgi:hypothetical protein